MGHFGKMKFGNLDDLERAKRCKDPEMYLSERLKKSSDFRKAINEMIKELRQMGHDLWSYDEEGEMEVWGPDYVQSKGPGLILTFTAPSNVIVEWSGRERNQ